MTEHTSSSAAQTVASSDAAQGGPRLLIVGPPGAGKGTQAKGIAERHGIPAISTGDIFRSNIKEQTELGKRVQEITSRGDLVPDSLTNELIESRLGEPDAAAGFLLDGYPRTLPQVEALDAILAREGVELDAVIELTANEDEVVERLLKRAQEQGRDDDNEETIRHRQRVYQAETAPVLDAYRPRGIVVTVDGLGSIDEVAERIEAALAEKGVGA